MLSKVLETLLLDCFEQSNLSVSSKILSDLVKFYSLRGKRVLGVDSSNELHIGTSYVEVRKNNVISYRVDDVIVKDLYVEQENPFNKFQQICAETDIDKIALKSGVPNVRLTGIYSPLHEEMNQRYVNFTLEPLCEKLEQLFTFLASNDICKELPLMHETPYHKIREFLANEINKSGN